MPLLRALAPPARARAGRGRGRRRVRRWRAAGVRGAPGGCRRGSPRSARRVVGGSTDRPPRRRARACPVGITTETNGARARNSSRPSAAGRSGPARPSGPSGGDPGRRRRVLVDRVAKRGLDPLGECGRREAVGRQVDLDHAERMAVQAHRAESRAVGGARVPVAPDPRQRPPDLDLDDVDRSEVGRRSGAIHYFLLARGVWAPMPGVGVAAGRGGDPTAIGPRPADPGSRPAAGRRGPSGRRAGSVSR